MASPSRPVHGSPLDPEGVITDPRQTGKKQWRPESEIPDHGDLEPGDPLLESIPRKELRPHVVKREEKRENPEDERDYDLE